MKIAALSSILLVLTTMAIYAQNPQQLAEIWEKNHVSKLFPSNVRHKDLQAYIAELKKIGLKVDEVGRSNAQREIYQVEFGTGPTKVFMWSQMHGDEPTATSALIDMLTYFQKNRDQDWVRNIANSLTIRAVPMLNPDGAEAYQRTNLQKIDINRDAINLKTPEAQLLKKLRDDWSPAIGFNLHNQHALSTVGKSTLEAAISFLVVYGDAAKTQSEAQDRNKRITSMMITALQPFIPGHIARYDDTYTASAFGDNFSAWGTPTILIETGELYGKDEMFLVKLNFIAFVTALNAIATGSEKTADPLPYNSLIANGSGPLVHFVFRRANIVSPETGHEQRIADIAAITERHRAAAYAFCRIVSVGDLNGLQGLDEYDASGFNVYGRFSTVKPGEMAELFFYKRDRVIDWNSTELEKQFPPDAVFSGSKWIRGAGLVPKK